MGDFTIPDVIRDTYNHFPTRLQTKRRDVVKRIEVKEIKTVERHDAEARVRTQYWIISKSWPNYPPYLRPGRSRQRRIPHYYDIVIEMDELTLTTKNWRMRVGSGRKWDNHPPQKLIKTLYPETRRRMRRQAERRTNNSREANKLYKELVDKHKRRAKYLDVGDYNSRERGLNGDWVFRQSYAYHVHGHLWGRNYYGNVPAPQTNPSNIVFFDKHQLNTLETLMRTGVIQ